MLKSKHRGSLLLEVLIATGILAMGILACLRIFSASIDSTQRLVRNQKLNQIMDGALFNWFLNPTGFNPEKAGNLHSEDSLITIKVRSESLSDAVNNDTKKSGVVQLQGQNSVEFFKTTFTPKYGRTSLNEEEAFLFTYGRRKKSS